MTKLFCDKCGKEVDLENHASLSAAWVQQLVITEKRSSTTGRGRKKQIRTSITEKKIPQNFSKTCILCEYCGLKLYDFLNKLGEDNNEN